MIENISIIIPTVKNEVLTLKSIGECPVPHEIILTRKLGLGYARNWGAKQAKHDLLTFLDDDLILKPSIWKEILNVKKGEFAMTFLSGFPCTRVMVIHKSDFRKIGGFDDSILYTGEDRDFYVRAIMNKLKWILIPIELTIHKQHLERRRNIHIAIRATRENMTFLVKYGRKFPKVFRVDFLDRLLKGQVRTLLLELILLPYCIIKEMMK